MADDAPVNGFTTKEMLLRIDSKLDMLSGRLTSAELNLAIAQAHLEDTRNLADKTAELAKEAKDTAQNIRSTLKYAAGAVAIIIFFSPFVFAIITHSHTVP